MGGADCRVERVWWAEGEAGGLTFRLWPTVTNSRFRGWGTTGGSPAGETIVSGTQPLDEGFTAAATTPGMQPNGTQRISQ